MKKNAAASLAGTSVVAFQDGVQVTEVRKGVEFDLHGSGFSPSVDGDRNSQAKVCLTGQVCVRTPVAADGTFDQTFMLYGVGTYEVHVYQGAGADLPPLVYSGTLTVVE